MIGDQTGLPYSSMGLTMALYVAINVSFCFPHEVDVRVLKILLALSAFSLVILACLPKFNFVSKVRPRILGYLIVGIMVLFMVRFKIVLYSAGSGVNNVAVDLSGLRMRSFLCVQLKMSSRYG